ncbi:hypothetical protein [Mycobacteroides abscessus]|nr:hypothetical protein [Mycobacteroides abscessus]
MVGLSGPTVVCAATDYRDKLRMTSNALPRTGTASKLGGDPSAKG